MLEKNNTKNDQIQHNTTKTNMNLNYEPEKNLILEMETENHEIRDKITITPNGMINSLREKNKENDSTTYFGYKFEEGTLNNIDYYLPSYPTGKSAELKENTNSNMLNINSSIDKNKGPFFKIYYDTNKHLYFLQDLGVGYGTFIKLQEETIIKENSIINIGESYLIFSFDKKNLQLNQEINDDDLFLKIYSNENEYEPIICKNNPEIIYTVGRSDKCDVLIKDKMLSRVHCILTYIDNNWYIRDGNEEGNDSTNGTWLYASDEIEIKEGLIFKSNSCNFLCQYQ